MRREKLTKNGISEPDHINNKVCLGENTNGIPKQIFGKVCLNTRKLNVTHPNNGRMIPKASYRSSKVYPQHRVPGP